MVVFSLLLALAFFVAPFSCYAQVVEDLPPTQGALPLTRVAKNGSYSGTLKIIRVEDHYTTTGCAIPENRKISFRVRTRGKKISVYTGISGMGTIVMTGRHSSRAWKSIIDRGSYTFRLHAKKVSTRYAYVTHKITSWHSGSTFCRWTWRGWVTRR